MQMGDQAQIIILSTIKDNANVILLNRQEEKLHQEQLTIIVIGYLTIARRKYLVKGVIEKGNEGKE